MIGLQIAHYKVTAKLGAGGMGEVYRATDSRLGRDVALKVLPEALASDQQRMARFQREAQLLASLNHPNIATIHGFEDAAGVRALVMELVEGPTLAAHIAERPLPVEETLTIARQIAEALEYAHEHGIIHRDLKPANIKLTADGKVKILDFGLAKALADDVAPQDISSSPTLSMAATKAGFILGTAAYMSPEQAKGRNVDRRTDIWAFGCVVYEMLTGKRAFGGEDVSETLAAIIRGEPEWSALPASASRLRALLQRCLQKDVRRRLQAVGDARVEIEEYLSHPEAMALPANAGGLPAPQKKSWRTAVPWAVAAILTVALVHAYWQLSHAPKSPARNMRLAMTIEPAKTLGTYGSVLAASPTGDLVAFAAGEPANLYVRSFADGQARLVTGTNGAHSPFFSPDGQWIGFFTPAGQMKKVAVAGGSPVTITEAGDGRGGTWTDDGTIIFTPMMNSGLQRVSADGGKAEPLSQPDRSKGERSHRWPRFLPGGKAVVFTIEKGATFDDSAIGVLRLDTREVRTVLEGGYDARYSPTGHLLYCRSGQLFAVPFNLSSLATAGAALPLPSRWVDFGGFGTGNYDLTYDGMLLHLPTAKEQEIATDLFWVDSNGRQSPATQKRRPFAEVSLAPNRRFAAVVLAAADNDIWLLDLERDSLTRLTTQGENGWAVWSPDSQRIAFNSTLGDDNSIKWMRSDGSGLETLVTGHSGSVFPHSWSADGRWIAFVEVRQESASDIWLLPIENGKPGKPRVFLNQKFNEYFPKISPDDRWIAYVSDESGRDEVYLQSFPEPGTKRQVSVDGGGFPRWAGANRLYYYSDEKILSVTLESRPELKVSRPSIVATGVALTNAGTTGMPYDVARDGRILLIRADRESMPRHIDVELNWFEELRRQLPK